MKTKMIAIALFAFAFANFTSHSFAQDQAPKFKGWDLAKNVKCRVIPTETGFSILFDHYVKAPVDEAVEQSSGKRGYDYYQAKSEYRVNSSDNTIIEVNNSEDVSSETRTYEPIRIRQKIDKSTPVILNRVSGAGTMTDASTDVGVGGGGGKAVYHELSLTRRCAGSTSVISLVDNECVIPTGDCPNGNCDLKIEWTWNDGTLITDTGGNMNRNLVHFSMVIEDGVGTAMAINEKGLPGDKPRKTKSKN